MMKGENFSQRETPSQTNLKRETPKQEPLQKGHPQKKETFSKEPIASREKRKWIEKQASLTEKTSPKKETAFTFSHEEQKKHSKLTEKAEKRENAYFDRDKKLPKRHALKLTEKNEQGVKQVKIHFETETKLPAESTASSTGKIRKSLLATTKKPLDEALSYGESEQSQDETALKTAIDKGTTTGAGAVKNTATAPARLGNWRSEQKYNKLHKAEDKASKASYKAFRYEQTTAYRKDPLSRTKPPSNPVSRSMQKKRFMKQYKKSLKERSRKASHSLVQLAKKVLHIITHHAKKMVAILLAILLFLFIFGSCMQALGAIGTGMLNGIVGTTFPAKDEDLSSADWYFSELEADKGNEIQNVEQTYPNMDEYRYYLNGSLTDKNSLLQSINHDTYELLAFLSVMYEDFTFEQIKGNIESLFNELFLLDFQTERQTRYRTVYDSEGNSRQEAYEYRILHIRFTVNDFQAVIQPHLDSKDGAGQYDEFIGTGGNHQRFGTPFNFNWYGNISCHYGRRQNPTGVGEQMHTGLDIAAPAGTPIYSVMTGTVVFAGWHSSYGNYVDIVDKEGNKSRYAHCSRLLVTAGQEIKEGQVIAEVGTTGNSTGNHLHIEIFIGGNRVNPIFLIKQTP